MIKAGPDLKDAIYQLFTVPTDYNSFSNTADGFNSIEAPHGNVHITVGGDTGHMAYPSYAAFDPIFFLHHANVDRLLALWQAINPNQYLTSNTNDFPNENTELHPFRMTQTTYWTSKLARDIKAFGYTYPELASGNHQAVVIAINQLYGPTPSKNKRKRDVSTTNGSSREEDPDNPSVASKPLVAVVKRAASETYDEYTVRIEISNIALYGSFSINIFLGQPSYNETDYNDDPNYVGSFNIFTRRNLPKSQKKLIKGTVSITKALNKLITTGKLKDLAPTTVNPYLKANFKWIISGAKTRDLDLDGLRITVVTAKVQLPKNQYALPVYGKFATIYTAV